MKVDLTPDEVSLLVTGIGTLLATMALDVPPGQPAPQAMLELEALQAKLMKAA